MTEEVAGFKARRKARLLAMQALYQWEMSDNELLDIEMQFVEHNDVNKVDMEYFRNILYGVPKKRSEIDTLFSQYLDRDISDLTPIELSVLRLAVYELIVCLDVPYKVVINEGLSLTRKFGSTCGYKYVNAILDQVAKEVRAAEVALEQTDG